MAKLPPHTLSPLKVLTKLGLLFYLTLNKGEQNADGIVLNTVWEYEQSSPFIQLPIL
jgi:hypothetical protein